MLSIPYASSVGSLMYGMVGTLRDIAHAIGMVSNLLKPNAIDLNLNSMYH